MQPLFHPDPSQMLAFCAMGNRLAKTAGTEVWTLTNLVGVTAYNVDDNQLANAQAKGTGLYLNIGASQGGGSSESILVNAGAVGGTYAWFDNTRGLDAVGNDVQTACFNVIQQATQAQGKFPFTDAFVDSLVSTAVSTLEKYATPALPFFQPTPAPSGWAPQVASLTSAQRASRVLPSLNLIAQFADALQGAQLNLTVSF